ncbi:hypothetical protein CHS0354_019873 [Potamilus streckersoni]|uniref:Coronin n=1 Tax=Potamilus streckersoni TaxID=2493646 RepID=A0AAE0SW47_9BIVA|nr:hypothetical protein CHS0354_019873 [Potamilus streckersoni]
MMAFHLRSSKFRHVYGKPFRREQCYENVRLTRNAHDSNFCDVNPFFIAIVTESAGGGSFIVLPLEKTGRIDINVPRVCGHAGAVMDIKWNPFNDHIIASGSDDNTVKLWQIPEKGLKVSLSEWQVDLHGHQRRVTYIDWHPTAASIILSASIDLKCILWNVEQAEPVNVINCHCDTIHSISWSRDGGLFSTTSKDRKLRIIDPRSGECAMETECHLGTKGAKSVFLGDTHRVMTSGFSRLGERQLAIWDIKNISQPLTRIVVDNSNGVLIPFYDHDTKVVFTAGKGDGNIRYYEMDNEAPFCHYLHEYMSSAPQKGLGVMPKRGCDPQKCEIMRFYKLHAAKNFVEPISMIVPRKSEDFQEDIFPPTASSVSSLTADEWISGQNREPILISMKDGRLDHAPTITTYKAITGSIHEKNPIQRANTVPTEVKHRPQEEGRTNIPASLKNIKRLSTNEEYVSISNDRPFVNDKIAVFESKKTYTEPIVVSPRQKNMEKNVWSPAPTIPPDVIANGIQGKSEHDKIHVKKVWSPLLSPPISSQDWQYLPDTDSELQKAYFNQMEEIKSLKEQITLKDKRINLLENELRKMKEQSCAGPGESDY